MRAVAAKVVAEVRPDFDERFPALWPAEVEIETVDGRTLRMQTDFPKGDPQNRLSYAEMCAKFRSLASAALSDTRARRGRERGREPRARRRRRR